MRRVLFLANGNPYDKNSWSGLLWRFRQGLEKRFEIEWIKPVRFNELPYRALLRAWQPFGGGIAYSRTLPFALHEARLLQRRIEHRQAELIFAPTTSMEIAFLKTRLPIVFASDSTDKIMSGYYDPGSRMPRWNRAQSRLIEWKAFSRASALLFASDWASSSAIHDYKIPVDKVHTLPFGPNLNEIPSRESLHLDRKSGCRLLFCGRDWPRKGLLLACGALKALKKMGIPATLSVVGCDPRIPGIDKEIRITPFLDKNQPDQEARLRALYAESDFFILPSRAECAGVVFSEASAFGLPILTTDTGGIPTYVENNVNGYRLPLSATAEDFAARIAEWYRDPAAVRRLRYGCRRKFEEELNWDTWTENFLSIIEDILSKRRQLRSVAGGNR
jgi:glycosyltransferase involved in cell wall biosynthesis